MKAGAVKAGAVEVGAVEAGAIEAGAVGLQAVELFERGPSDWGLRSAPAGQPEEEPGACWVSP